MPTNNILWQIPETCEWNPYIHHATQAISERGWSVITPGVCIDGPNPATSKQWNGPIPTIVHVHWPEKLACTLGSDQALELLRWLKSRGSRIVQTVHNVSEHEPTTPAAYQHKVDQLTDGVHYFSARHQAMAQATRPGLPPRAVHFSHPRYETSASARLGCFGRIRDYKRTADFAEALLDHGDLPVELLVVGHPDSPEADKRLRALAARDSRLDYRPQFVTAGQFHQALASVEWVALPYRGLHSSGVLVSALQAGRRVLSPKPVGGTELYGTFDASRWITISPWDDQQAISAWRAVALPDLALPTWAIAADILTSFYADLVARPPLT